MNVLKVDNTDVRVTSLMMSLYLTLNILGVNTQTQYSNGFVSNLDYLFGSLLKLREFK